MFRERLSLRSFLQAKTMYIIFTCLNNLFSLICCFRILGVSNGPIQFKSARKIRPLLELPRLLVLAKFLLLLACSDSRSNSCMANLSTLGKYALVMNASGNMHPGSVCCRLIETEARTNSFRKPPAK